MLALSRGRRLAIGLLLLLSINSAYLLLIHTDALPQQAITDIVWQLRLPRLLTAISVGAILAVCGTAMQAQFRNPLADPGLVGVAGGAGLGAAFAIALHSPAAVVAIAAFAGALGANVLAQFLNQQQQPQSLLLAGVAINALSGAILAVLFSLVSDPVLRSIQFWLLGSFAYTSLAQAIMLWGISVAVCGYFLRRATALNVLLLGSAQAYALGLDVKREQQSLNLVVACGVGGAVAMTGMVGFIGLMVPHILRRCGIGHHRQLIPLAALAGGGLALAADTVAQYCAPPLDLPVGAMTSLAGAPFFLYLLRQQQRPC